MTHALVTTAHTPLFKENTLLIDRCGCAIIGCTEEGNAVYSYERLVDHFTPLTHEPDEDPIMMGIKYVDSNVVRALITPIEGAIMPYIIAEWDEEATGDIEQDCLIRGSQR